MIGGAVGDGLSTPKVELAADTAVVDTNAWLWREYDSDLTRIGEYVCCRWCLRVCD